jgi:hypothetical protein
MPRKKRPPSPFSDELIDSLLQQGDTKELLSGGRSGERRVPDGVGDEGDR